MKRYFLLLLFASLCFFFGGRPVFAQDSTDCASCHKNLNTKQIVHSPVANGKCMICHTTHDTKVPKLLKEANAGITCMECHDDLEIADNTSKHAPVEQGNCQACHDPHQSDIAKLLKRDGQDLCYSCHTKEKEMLSLKVVHKPFENKCSVCHSPHGSKSAHMLTQNLTELCFACHDDLQYEIEEAKVKHPVVTEGKSCSTCHTPHASANDKLLLGENPGSICISCHKMETEGKKVVHAAVSKGQCSACHDPHKSANKGLVKDLTPEGCLTCHEDSKKQMEMANIHPPFKNKCSICHVPHASDEIALLKTNPRENCLGCHDDMQYEIDESAFIHKPMNEGKSCVLCHSPHASVNGKLLIAEKQALCLNCHNKSSKKDGKTIPGFKQQFEKHKFVHGAIAKEGCTSCHNPHYAKNEQLLVAAYNTDFYMGGAKDSLALCFNCHDGELMTAAATTKTSFRDGSRNLHYVHLNGPKGRNCNVCHEIHAADNKHLLKEKIPFGSWSMNMVFTEQENGASCQTGCHAEKKYIR